jgi:MFS family permease
MTVADVAVASLSDLDHRTQLRRAVIASTVGTTIEWYDFLLYGQMAAIVFAKLYFPSSDPLTGTLQSFAVFAVGFAARPIGAAIFGHYGDRIGRKAALIATLLLTGLSTFLVGCVPTYEQIGIWGAVVLVALRFIQGIGVGGEWGGSVLLSMEWARTNKNHGVIAAWPQFGGATGFFLANLAILAFSQLSRDQFLSWGWRVPFWLSLIMVVIGLWIRLSILETPIFQQVLAEGRVARTPVVEVFKRQPKEVFLTAFARMGQMVAIFVYTAFVFPYGLQHTVRCQSRRHRLAERRHPMDRWDVLIESLFDDWDREISDQGTLSGIKEKIADAKAEAGSDYYMGDDAEETSEERMDDFQEHLIEALEKHLEEFADNKTSYELMLTYLTQDR